ncbi:MAG: dual specificity protein phosphatase family protein [Thermodesulfobacteriota bacterium]|nr:dual specificity protein phosphatase family protein [Thermodesulfobacteriota bacterium]
MYELTWITNQIAAGYAPMSYEELETIKEGGIDAIINLCGEFSDLHEIEEQAGFEVYYLPTPDECAPDLAEMEKALEWLDEAIYLKKKILVHCRHGHGRTGTLISAYMLRRGLGLKKSEKLLKNTRANPTNYSQWKLLRKYNKQEGLLTIAEPQLDNQSEDNLAPFLLEYEAFLQELEDELTEHGGSSNCGQDTTDCCTNYFELQLAESIWINNSMNRKLSQDERQQAIERAGEYSGVMKTVTSLQQKIAVLSDMEFKEIFQAAETPCPLLVGGKCQLYENRPFRCRWAGSTLEQSRKDEFTAMLVNLSRNMYLALTGVFPPEGEMQFSIADTVSGRFVQSYFKAMLMK